MTFPIVKQILELSFKMHNVHWQEEDGQIFLWKTRVRFCALINDEGLDSFCQLDISDDGCWYGEPYFPEKDPSFLGVEYDDDRKEDSYWIAMATRRNNAEKERKAKKEEAGKKLESMGVLTLQQAGKRAVAEFTAEDAKIK